MKAKPSSITSRKSRDVLNSLSNLMPEKQGKKSRLSRVEESDSTDLNIQEESFSTGENRVDQGGDEPWSGEYLEARSLTSTNNGDGWPNPQLEWLSPQQKLTYSSLEVVSQKDARSFDTFLDLLSEDPLDLQKVDAKSFDDEYLFDVGNDDFPWRSNASLPWGNDDEYPMDEGDAGEMMQLAQVEKEMTMTEDASIAHSFDAGNTPQCLSTHNANMIDHSDDHPWEVDDLFIESLQDDWNDSEPQEDADGKGSVGISSTVLEPRSSPCFSNMDTVCEYVAEAPETMIDDHHDSVYDDEELDRELLNIGTSAFDNVDEPSRSTPPSSPVPVPTFKPPLPGKRKRPLDMPHIISFDADGKALPFVRPPFAKPMRERPVIHALRPQPVLRTCFRIGEALNAGCAALSSDTDAIIELYARVAFSTREPGSYKQQFRFADLFTADKPPLLSGVYALWKGVELWDRGSRLFLGETGHGRMARVVGRMRKEDGEWMMVILCVWQVDWEEIKLAKGVVCS